MVSRASSRAEHPTALAEAEVVVSFIGATAAVLALLL